MAEKNGALDRDAARRVALVTGASRGIGRAIAEGLAADGFDVALVYAGNEAAAAEAVAACEANGATARAYRCDVANADEVKATVDAVLADFGSVWALVNNAGVTRDGLLVRMSDEDFARVIDVNLKGAFHTARALARAFMRQRGGRVVNMASVVGLMGNAGPGQLRGLQGGAWSGLTKSLARELAPRGVTVNAIAPGFVETDMTAVLSESVVESYREADPARAPGKRRRGGRRGALPRERRGLLRDRRGHPRRRRHGDVAGPEVGSREDGTQGCNHRHRRRDAARQHRQGDMGGAWSPAAAALAPSPTLTPRPSRSRWRPRSRTLTPRRSWASRGRAPGSLLAVRARCLRRGHGRCRPRRGGRHRPRAPGRLRGLRHGAAWAPAWTTSTPSPPVARVAPPRS